MGQRSSEAEMELILFMSWWCDWQARLSDLHCESLHREHHMEKQLNLNAAKQSSSESCGYPFLCGGSRVSSSQPR